MSNSNTNLQTQSSNALHNAIMEAGSKDHPPMLEMGKLLPVAEGSSETTTERYMENYKNVSQDIRDQLNRHWYNNQRAVNVAGARENVGTPVVQKSGIQCYNCKEYRHLNAEQADWKDDTDDESKDQGIKAYYMYMAQIQEVTPDPVDNSRPIFDDEPLHKVTACKTVLKAKTRMTRQPIAVPISTREPKHNVNQSATTSSKKTITTDSIVKKSRHTTRKLYEQVSKTCRWWYPKNAIRTANILEHKTPRCSTVSNTPLSSNSFTARTMKFGNDQIAPILGYGDLVQGTITIKWVYYVEWLNHNLFSIGQFCDADLEVAFRKSTCYIRDLKGKDLLTGSRGTNFELLNGTSPVVSKSSAVHAADLSDKRQQHNTTHTSTTIDVADPPPLNIQSTHQTPTQVPTVTAPENIIQAKTNTENAQFGDDEFINIFSTPVQEQQETLSRHLLDP
ncbi:hypothetical protein Tco_0206004 [Tanacetum coccineum]